MNRVIAKINLKKYSANLKLIRNNIILPRTKLLAVLKANAYGHGIVDIARCALKSGVVYLGVARLSEVITLRQNGIKAPILLFNEPKIDFLSEVIDRNVVQTVYSSEFASDLNAFARKKNKKVTVHIKIDTGMNRLGCGVERGLAFVKEIMELRNLYVEGIFTHFANAENPDSDYNTLQLEQFMSLLELLEENHIRIPIKHAANSAATLNYPNSHLDMVRIGILSYKDILTLSSYLGHIRFVKKGSPISYNGEHVAQKDTYIGIVFCGYSDGIPVLLSNKGEVIINGRYYPIIGRICMDMLMIDLGTDDPLPKLNSEVIFIGKENDKQITVDDICEETKQIPYELLCGFNERAKRIYINLET
ncbi:alanine racemase [Candidatus Margulisiibacteriota bacterium]